VAAPPQHGQYLAFTAGQPVALTRVGLGLADPQPHRGLGQVEVLGDLTTERSPRRHTSTISALNSGGNEQ
jgi:hypothetical protein